MITRANVIITHNCNLRCKHCYINAGSYKENYEQNYNQCIQMIHQLAEDGIKSIMLTGGECMLFPRLIDLIKEAKKLNLSVSIFTNGMIFNKEIFDIVDSINISLDGPEKIHNEIRQNNNSFNNIIKVLDYLKKIDKITTLQMTLNNYNIKHLDFIGKFVFDYLNVRTVKLVMVSNIGRAEKNGIYHNENDIENVYKKLDSLYSDSKYHVQFVPSVMKNYDFENYYLSGDINFPLWIDVPKGKYYILNEQYMGCSLSDYSFDTVTKMNDKLLKTLINHKERIMKDKYIDLENVVSNIIRGDYNGK